jgi:hypothetical protein
MKAFLSDCRAAGHNSDFVGIKTCRNRLDGFFSTGPKDGGDPAEGGAGKGEIGLDWGELLRIIVSFGVSINTNWN